jgi:hypothetical protein
MADNNTPKEYQIKCNGWHKVILTGNILTGDTYPVKNFIKNHLNGKWYPQANGWIVDLNLVAKYNCEGTNTIMVK